jgi:hypothetical protein
MSSGGGLLWGGLLAGKPVLPTRHGMSLGAIRGESVTEEYGSRDGTLTRFTKSLNEWATHYKRAAAATHSLITGEMPHRPHRLDESRNLPYLFRARFELFEGVNRNPFGGELHGSL